MKSYGYGKSVHVKQTKQLTRTAAAIKNIYEVLSQPVTVTLT